MKLKLIVIFCFFSSILFGQTKADLCKTSIKNYCKKNYSLYKAVEFSRFEKSYFVYDDNTIDIWFEKLLNKTNELKDTILIKKINKYLLTHSVVIYNSTDYSNDSLTKIEIAEIKGKIYNKFITFNADKESNIDSVFINNVLITNKVFLNYDEKDEIQVFTFTTERDKLTKPAYIYAHIYEALTQGGTKRYFSSLFYLDTKTYKVLEEVELYKLWEQ